MVYSNRISKEPDADGPTKPIGVRPLSSALKTLALLDTLSACEKPVQLVQLAKLSNASPATIYQRLVTLVAAGWAEQTPEGRFRLTLRAGGLARAAAEQAGLGLRTLPVLEALVAETGEAASLAVLEDGEPLVVQRVDPGGLLRIEMRIGATMSLSESAAGRVLLAFDAGLGLWRAKKRGLAMPPASVLDEVRACGHAMSTGQGREGVRAAAVPVLDGIGNCVAALSIISPIQRFPKDGWANQLRNAARLLSSVVEGGRLTLVPA